MSNDEAIKYLQQIYPHGGHSWLDEQRTEAIRMAIEALKEKPVSEDLEEAVNAYIGYAPEVDECSSVYGKRKAFKAGANWQRSQLMRNAIEVVISDDTTICNAIEVMKLQEKYKGQKVRITVIKEE